MTGTPEGLSPEAARLLDAILAERGPEPRGPERIPATRAQARLWELAKLAPGSAWGNLPLVFEVRPAPDLAALEAALADVIARHPTLRMRYEEEEGRLYGRVGERPAPALVIEEAEPGPDPDARREAALERIRALAREPLDPGRDLALRARWYPTGEGEGLLFLLTHHLAADGFALGLLLRELSARYAARAEGRAAAGDGLAAAYARAVEAERSAPAPGAAALAYWEERLAGAPREVPLPRASGAVGEAYRSGRALGALEPGASAALRRVAAEAGVTPFAAWLALLGSALASLTGEPDIVIGTTISDRSSSERERLVANFGNNLLLRARFAPEARFSEVLGRLGESLPRDLAHQEVTIEDLIRRAPGGSRPPRLNVLYMLRDGSPDDHLALAGSEAVHVPVEAGASMPDLALDVQDLGEEGFAFALEHRLARLPGGEAEALARGLERAARAVSEAPDLPLDELPLDRGRWAAAPAEASSPTPRAAEALRPAEEMLAALWREALELEEVDPLDNFFELGGHSLLAIDLLERIEERTGVRLTPVDLVSQTLGQLAAAIEEGAPSGEGPADTEETGAPRAAEGERRPGWLARLRGAGGGR